MEKLGRIRQWLPPEGETYGAEYYRKNHFPVIKISPEEANTVPQLLSIGVEELLKFARSENINPNEIWSMFDIDYVLRNPPHEFFSGHPGRLPKESIKILKKLERLGVNIAGFATNQPVEGHQVAEWVGRAKGYLTILSVLKANFPQAEIISAGKDWGFAWRRPKTNQTNVERVSYLINESDRGLFAFFGDRYDVDAKFLANIQKIVSDSRKNKLVFVKLPNPALSIPAARRLCRLMP